MRKWNPIINDVNILHFAHLDLNIISCHYTLIHENKKKEAKIKEDKKKAIEEVKNLIATYKISSGDLRGKTMNILNAKSKKK